MTNKTSTITENQDVSRTINTYSNLDDNDIYITETRLENILLKHKTSLSAGSDWKTPFGLIIAISIVFPTTQFKSFLGFEPSMWQSCFFIVLLISIAWLIYSLYKRWESRDASLDNLIKTIKNQKEDVKNI